MYFPISYSIGVAISLATSYVVVTITNMLGLSLAFINSNVRKNNLASAREYGGFQGYSDWQIVALMFLIGIFPYMNLIIYRPCLEVIQDQLTIWVKSVRKKQG